MEIRIKMAFGADCDKITIPNSRRDSKHFSINGMLRVGVEAVDVKCKTFILDLGEALRFYGTGISRAWFPSACTGSRVVAGL